MVCVYLISMDRELHSSTDLTMMIPAYTYVTCMRIKINENYKYSKPFVKGCWLPVDTRPYLSPCISHGDGHILWHAPVHAHACARCHLHVFPVTHGLLYNLALKHRAFWTRARGVLVVYMCNDSILHFSVKCIETIFYLYSFNGFLWCVGF